MQLLYRSTRGGERGVTASLAILKGLAEDGGLFVPERMPVLDRSLSDLSRMSYKELAFEVMRLFLTDFTEEELKNCIDQAYDEKFDTPLIAPLHRSGNAWYLELFHGATIAFKDMALSILPHLMTTAAKKNQAEGEIVILTATSGDTGKAAMAGFADVPGTKIIVFYPKHGVSAIQEKQMLTQKGDNTHVVGILGNFDDAQSRVKAMFRDEKLKADIGKCGCRFSSANSINIGRLVPQICYYVYAYASLLRDGVIREGEKINVTVPTGNFGNILAAWYAKKIGLPIAKLICASNENRVLYDFFRSGIYDRNRPFILTSSPSMDILISSNLERLVFELDDENPETLSARMQELAEKGLYTISREMSEKLADFAAGTVDNDGTMEEIRRVYEESGYVIDTHTAVASGVYHIYRENSGDETVTVIASTASPFKFTRNVMKALGRETDEDDLTLADALSGIAKVPVPPAVSELKNAQIRHNTVVETEDMEKAVRAWLGVPN